MLPTSTNQEFTEVKVEFACDGCENTQDHLAVTGYNTSDTTKSDEPGFFPISLMNTINIIVP